MIKKDIKQCKKNLEALQKNIEALQKNLKKILEEESRLESVENDKVAEYIKEHHFRYSKEIGNVMCGVVREGNHVKVVLPTANSDWTWEAYLWARDFCNYFGNMSYPVHRPEHDNTNFLYIYLPNSL